MIFSEFTKAVEIKYVIFNSLKYFIKYKTISDNNFLFFKNTTVTVE